MAEAALHPPGDEPGVFHFAPVKLGEPVYRLAQQFGARMFGLIPSPIIRRAPQTEVGGQIDHLHAALQKPAGDLRRRTVRQSQKRESSVYLETLFARHEDRFGKRVPQMKMHSAYRTACAAV